MMQAWQFIKQKLQEQKPVILLYVLHSEGSSPGRQGFHMAVAENQDFCGSIGGGMMEHKFVEMAGKFLSENKSVSEVFRQVHDKAAGKNKSGMICSGEQTIFMYSMQQHDLPAVIEMLQSGSENHNGSLMITPKGIQFSQQIPSSHFQLSQTKADFLLTEKTGFKNEIHIVGGGHCALALSQIMSVLGFRIFVYDDRQNLNTMQQNLFAHEKIFLDSYDDLPRFINHGRNVYVVIMTFGFRTDDIALKALAGKAFKYLGVLGSRNKLKKMFSSNESPALASSKLKLHAPVGLQIKSQTPAEIAVSIAAEIISVKNADQ